MTPFLRRPHRDAAAESALPGTVDESGVVEPTPVVPPAAPLAPAAPSPLELELVAERDARLRLAADIANLRRRSGEEHLRARAEGQEAALGPLLETADDLRRALDLLPNGRAEDPWIEGVAAIARRLDERLAAAGLIAVGAPGEPFDPRLHEAVERLAHGAEGTIIAVRRIGYRVGDRLVRPAMVAVGGGEPEPDTDNIQTTTAPTKED